MPGGTRTIIATQDGSPTVADAATGESFHSVHGALTESRHVFINNGLMSLERDPVRVLEAGFGTGLNALLTWLEAERGGITVEYTAIEKYPLERKIWEKLSFEHRPCEVATHGLKNRDGEQDGFGDHAGLMIEARSARHAAKDAHPNIFDRDSAESLVPPASPVCLHPPRAADTPDSCDCTEQAAFHKSQESPVTADHQDATQAPVSKDSCECMEPAALPGSHHHTVSPAGIDCRNSWNCMQPQAFHISVESPVTADHQYTTQARDPDEPVRFSNCLERPDFSDSSDTMIPKAFPESHHHTVSLASIDSRNSWGCAEPAECPHQTESLPGCIEGDILRKMHEAPWDVPVNLSPRFVLRKICSDLEKPLPDAIFDLVYWDAFSPSVQPELWTSDIFAEVARRMSPGAVLVTYCSKGDVKRALRAAGLQVQRLDGPPGKRHMLRAVKPL